jgi:hypothetical protein
LRIGYPTIGTGRLCISIHGVGASAEKQNSNACNTWSDHDWKKLKIQVWTVTEKFLVKKNFKNFNGKP